MSMTTQKTDPASPADKLEYAIHLAQTGKRAAARDMLRRQVALQPVNPTAWLWLAVAAADEAEAEAALNRVRQINPNHPQLADVKQQIKRRFLLNKAATKATRTQKLPAAMSAINNTNFFNNLGLGLVLGAIIIGLTALFLGLNFQLNVAAKSRAAANPVDETNAGLATARANRNWSQVIAILEPLTTQDPANTGLTEQLADAYWQKGLNLRHKGFITEAHPLFEKTTALLPAHALANQELQLSAEYLQGIEFYQAGQWAEAIEALQSVWSKDKTYPNIADLLYSAYFNHGLARQATGDLTAARESFQAAIALHPDLTEPREQLAKTEFSLAPGTPLATPLGSPTAKDQLVMVGIAEQQMLVFDKDEQVFDFVVSTGEPGRDTAIGEFEILNKIDVAYASTWNLDMPYWLGIYWAGPLQNGIHALPIVKHTGYKLWDGYLGQRVSYGCIILSDEDAATLYNWIEVGAKIKIVPSLTAWQQNQ
jgi:tetratricopeptide (TPR) repeat protein